jgi:hypothetical protein
MSEAKDKLKELIAKDPEISQAVRDVQAEKESEQELESTIREEVREEVAQEVVQEIRDKQHRDRLGQYAAYWLTHGASMAEPRLPFNIEDFEPIKEIIIKLPDDSGKLFSDNQRQHYWIEPYSASAQYSNEQRKARREQLKEGKSEKEILQEASQYRQFEILRQQALANIWYWRKWLGISDDTVQWFFDDLQNPTPLPAHIERNITERESQYEAWVEAHRGPKPEKRGLAGTDGRPLKGDEVEISRPYMDIDGNYHRSIEAYWSSLTDEEKKEVEARIAEQEERDKSRREAENEFMRQNMELVKEGRAKPWWETESE